MINELIVKNILRQLRLGRRYSGYDYIVFALGLMFFKKDFITCMSKVLYLTIAQSHNTSAMCVEKNIRNAIDVIWKNEENKILIEKYFGSAYVNNRPSNKEFLCLLYEYVESYDLVMEIFDLTESICPTSQSPCGIYTHIVNYLRGMS